MATDTLDDWFSVGIYVFFGKRELKDQIKELKEELENCKNAK